MNSSPGISSTLASGVKIAALLLYLGAFLLLLTRRFQTLVLIGGISLVLIAAEYDNKVAPGNFGIGMAALIVGIILTTVELWWKALAPAFEGDEEEEEQVVGTDKP